MPARRLRASFDAATIQLDEPNQLPRNAQRPVTVLPSSWLAVERAEWAALSAKELAQAYDDHEPDDSEADTQS
ncbi:MAG: hypothetical protein GX575_05745 [Candidatus Anammoximicrobium sp.]|nr:hypothetical protein [Candidatus Anammoximicrobium sp.]